MNPIFILRIWTVVGKMIEFEFSDDGHNKTDVREQMDETEGGPLALLPSPIKPGEHTKISGGMTLDTSKVVSWEIE